MVLKSLKIKLVFALSTIFLLKTCHAFTEENKFDSFYKTAKANCHDVASIRVEMDRINYEILNLLTERTAYVKRAGDLKFQTTKIADDRQRVLDQENKIIENSILWGMPTEISVPTFRVMMESSIQFQQRYIDQLNH